jgi:hypothetical protein
MIKKYDIEDICTAIQNKIDSWDTISLQQFAYERLYDDYTDRSEPIEYVDELMEEFGP